MNKDELDIVEDSIAEENRGDDQEVVTAPKYGTKEWNAYVLSFLDEDELQMGNPTVDGLRRVAELLIGPIVDMHTEVVQTPCPDNQMRATCVVTINIENVHSGAHISFSGAADAFPGNVPGASFSQFPVALAETRAEGRALKRILKLRKICSAEEVNNVPVDNNDLDVEKINSFQIDTIDRLCSKNNINVEKFVKSLVADPKVINDVTRSQAGEDLMAALSQIENKVISIDADLVGYDNNWKQGFYK